MIGFVLMIARSFLPFFSLFQSFTFWFKWGFLPLPFISFVWSVNGAFFPSPWFYCCAYHLSCFVFFSTPGTLYLSLPPPFMPFIDKIPAFSSFFFVLFFFAGSFIKKDVWIEKCLPQKMLNDFDTYMALEYYATTVHYVVHAGCCKVSFRLYFLLG